MVMIGATAPRDAYPRAQEAAARALALDSTLADAHLANGLVALWYNWRPSDAAGHFERALAVNPSHAAAHHDYAWSLVALGRFDEAVEQITAARDLDPLSTRANTDIGWLYLHLRQPTEAARACQHTLAMQPNAPEPQACLERAYIQRGLYDQALRAAESSLPERRQPPRDHVATPRVSARRVAMEAVADAAGGEHRLGQPVFDRRAPGVLGRSQWRDDTARRGLCRAGGRARIPQDRSGARHASLDPRFDALAEKMQQLSR